MQKNARRGARNGWHPSLEILYHNLNLLNNHNQKHPPHPDKKNWRPRWFQWFSSVQSLSHIWLFVTPWTAAHQASLSITNSWGLLKLMSIKSVMPSNPLILCHTLLLLALIFPSIKVLSSELVLHIRWPKYWNFSFSISPSNEYSGLIYFRIDLFDLLAVQL